MNVEEGRIKGEYRELITKFNNFGQTIKEMLNSNLQEELILLLPIE